MALTLVTAPLIEPVTLAEAKDHLRVSIADDDDYITGLIAAARRFVENDLGRALITQTWDLFLSEFPTVDEIEIPHPPLQSVTSLKYKNSAGTETTWAASNYIVDTNSEPGRIVLTYSNSWPTDTLYPANPITIRFVAGYGDDRSDVDSGPLHATKLLISAWYENREPVLSGSVITKEIPLAYESLIWRNRVF